MRCDKNVFTKFLSVFYIDTIIKTTQYTQTGFIDNIINFNKTKELVARWNYSTWIMTGKHFLQFGNRKSRIQSLKNMKRKQVQVLLLQQ